MAEIEGIPLWKYWPSHSVDKAGVPYSFNFYVILGFQGAEFFFNIRSKVAAKVELGRQVPRYNTQNMHYVADVVINSPDEFLKRAIGTTDRESEQYKKFKEECDLYKAEIMKRRLTDEHGARSPD